MTPGHGCFKITCLELAEAQSMSILFIPVSLCFEKFSEDNVLRITDHPESIVNAMIAYLIDISWEVTSVKMVIQELCDTEKSFLKLSENTNVY